MYRYMHPYGSSINFAKRAHMLFVQWLCKLGYFLHVMLHWVVRLPTRLLRLCFWNTLNPSLIWQELLGYWCRRGLMSFAMPHVESFEVPSTNCLGITVNAGLWISQCLWWDNPRIWISHMNCRMEKLTGPYTLTRFWKNSCSLSLSLSFSAVLLPPAHDHKGEDRDWTPRTHLVCARLWHPARIHLHLLQV